MPFEYKKRSDNRSLPEPGKNLPKPSSSLSKSTKTLLIVVVTIMIAVIIFFIIHGITRPTPEVNPLNKLTANLQIFKVQIINYTDLNVKVETDNNNGNVTSISFIVYGEGNSVITRKQFSIDELKKDNFQASLHVANTSKIKEISVIPTFVTESGSNVIGKVEDTYTVSNEEKYSENISLSENNGSINQSLPSCTSDSQCNDNNSCTTNTCLEGNCSYPPIENCVPCLSSSQCEDSNNCTANTCSDGRCVYLSIPGCTQCASSSNCEDNNSCTTNTCLQGRCLYTQMENCKGCVLNSDCEDNNPCTADTCSNGTCLYTPISGCKSCTSSSQCEDNDSSTTNACSNNKCAYTKVISCINGDGYCPTGCNYTNDNNCAFTSSCGNGIREGTERCDNFDLGGATCSGVLGAGYTGTLKCFSGLCTFNTSLCAAPCVCPDEGNPCTDDVCQNNVCQHIATSGCCISNSQCEDNDSSTINACSNNKCAYTKITSCINGDGYCPTGCNSANDNNCASVCGNGIREGAEGCDDGGKISGDGCSSNCTIESGYSCNTATPNVCTKNCVPNCSGKTCGSDGCETNNNCGTCSTGQTCNSAGQCVSTCTDTCSSLGYNCGTKIICEASKNCGSCTSPQTCNINNVCTNPTLPAGAIIIDHTTTDISKIPACWIEKAKVLTLQYAHRSDGNNLLEGLGYLYSKSSALKYNVKVNSLPSQTNPIQLRIMDGNPPMNAYSYADYYWASADGRAATEANWASGQFDASMWSWCSELEVSSSDATATTAMVQSYLNTMNSMEADYPDLKFIYMTSYTQNSNPYLVANNKLIRNYAINNKKILYDFEDIGKYDPDGNYYPNADRACSWCSSWCSSHSSYCANLPTTCSHTNGLLCAQRSKALWWLMARLAGWDGVSTTC